MQSDMAKQSPVKDKCNLTSNVFVQKDVYQFTKTVSWMSNSGAGDIYAPALIYLR